MKKPAQDCILALDVGTTNIRAVVYGPGLSLLHTSVLPCPPTYTPAGGVEYDLDKAWQTVTRVMADCLGYCDRAGKQVAGLALTTQRNVLAIWDAKDGRPVMPAISWQDPRGGEHLSQLKKDGFDQRFSRKLGLSLGTNCVGLKLSWLMATRPEIAAGLRSGRLLAGPLDTWLVYQMSRGRLFITDESSAAMLGLYNLHQRNWEDDALAALGLDVIELPEVVNSIGRLGTVLLSNAKETELSALCVDQQVALFGHGCHGPGEAKCTIGTGAFVMVNLGDRPMNVLPELRNRVAWSWQGGVAYALEGVLIHAGSLFDWLFSLGLARDLDEAHELAASEESSQGLVLLPALSGLGAPHWRPDVKGSLSGLTAGTTSAHIWRAAWEAVAMQVVDVLRLVEQRTDLKITQLKVDGGVAACDGLMGLLASLANLEVCRPARLERTSLGVAALAGLSLGWWSRPSDIPLQDKDEGQGFSLSMDQQERSDVIGRWDRVVSDALSNAEKQLHSESDTCA